MDNTFTVAPATENEVDWNEFNKEFPTNLSLIDDLGGFQDFDDQY